MRYFFIEPDKNYSTIPTIKNWYNKVPIRQLEREGLKILPRRCLYRIEEADNLYYVDILFHPFPMVSSLVKSVIELYEPMLQWKQVILLHQKQGRVEIYYIPLLEEKEYVYEKTKFTLTHNKLLKLTLEQKKLGDTAVFFLKKESYHFMILRLDVLESLLRRNAKGFLLQEAECIGGGNICQKYNI